MLKTLLLIFVAFLSGFFMNQYLHELQSADEVQIPVMNPELKQQPLIVENIPENNALPLNPLTAVFSFEEIEQWLANNQASEAIVYLQQELIHHPESMRLWQLIARAYQKVGNHRDAIVSWFNYFKYESDAQKSEESKTHFKQYLLSLAKDIPSGVDAAWLAQQLNDYIQLTVDDPELHLAAASLYVNTDDNYQAQYHALMAVNNPVTQERAEKILAQLNGTEAVGDVVLPLIRFGNQFLVAVTIEGYPARLLLDTGASLTGVSAEYIKKYPNLVKTIKPIRLSTANGAVDSYLFTVNELSLGETEFHQHIIAKLPLELGIEFDGLLGVDVLGRFDFVIDQYEAVLRLGQRR